MSKLEIQFLLEDLWMWTRVIVGILLIVGGVIALAVLFPPIIILYVLAFGFWLLG